MMDSYEIYKDLHEISLSYVKVCTHLFYTTVVQTRVLVYTVQ